MARVASTLLDQQVELRNIPGVARRLGDLRNDEPILFVFATVEHVQLVCVGVEEDEKVMAEQFDLSCYLRPSGRNPNRCAVCRHACRIVSQFSHFRMKSIFE